MSELVEADIDKLEAGRELDSLIAQMILGIDLMPVVHEEHEMVLENPDRDTHLTCKHCGETDEGELPKACVENVGFRYYSTDIKAAWDVVEKLGFLVCPNEDGGWVAFEFSWHPGEVWFGEHDTNARFNGYGDTAPLAICRAALKAIGYAQ